MALYKSIIIIIIIIKLFNTSRKSITVSAMIFKCHSLQQLFIAIVSGIL